MQGINIEIKARAKDLNSLRNLLTEQGAVLHGIDHQTDTYFKVEKGRLKLRQGNIENNLIHYFRENQSGPKKSKVIVYPVNSNPEELKIILSTSCGILAEVKKNREIYYLGNAKFHLDKLSGLGEFVEIEVFGNDTDSDHLWKTCQNFMNILGISEDDLVSESYSDMLLSSQGKH